METTVRSYREQDVPDMVRIWNEVVEEGIAFPQEEPLTMETGTTFFASQTYCGTAVDRKQVRCLGFISCIPIMRAGADISATPAMRSAGRTGGGTRAKSWSWTVWSRDGFTDSGCCSSMRWWRPICMQGICTNGLALSSWG